MSEAAHLVESVRRGMLVDDPQDSVQVMQQGVAELIRSTEKTVEVHLTGHFNNTWIPDMTLSWPGGGRRDVFLRTAAAEEYIHEDLRIQETRHAMIVKLPDLSLGPARPEPEDSAILDNSTAEGLLSRSAVESHALVAETESLGEVADSATRYAGLGIFSQSLIRGGQGFLPKEKVAPVLTAIEDSFKGAAQGEAGSTDRGIEVASQYLSVAEDRKIEELLQLIWIGAGHVSTKFPSRRTHVSASLDSSSLTFLLDNEDLGDEEFWSRLASTIDFDVILGLANRTDASIDRLVRRVVGGLMAKGCSVETSDDVVSDGEGSASSQLSKWSVENYALKLVAEKRNFYIAPSRSRIPPVPALDLTSSELLERTNRYGAKVSSLEVVGGDRSVMLGGLSDGLAPSDVNGLDRLVGDRAPIRSAQIKSRRGGQLEVQPTHARVAGNSNSRWGVEDLVRSAAELLVDLDLSEDVFTSLPELGQSTSAYEETSSA